MKEIRYQLLDSNDTLVVFLPVTFEDVLNCIESTELSGNYVRLAVKTTSKVLELEDVVSGMNVQKIVSTRSMLLIRS